MVRQIGEPRPPRYVWERASWPQFHWSAERVLPALVAARKAQGLLWGALGAANIGERQIALSLAIVDESLETSEIEGEPLDAAAVRSSVARRLGLPEGGLGPEDARAEAVVAVTLDATQRYAEALTLERIHGWHAAFFPEPRSGLAVARWRDDATGPMQVVSGPIHLPTVHFEAPPASRVVAEVDRFLAWFEDGGAAMDGLIRAAHAHLWIVTIHPYEDGNGRIARAVADLALARDEASSDRFVSMSRQIRREKARYYAMLESTQKGDLEISAWLVWFLECYARAAEYARIVLDDVLRASRFWKAHQHVHFTTRQKNVIDKLLHQFEGAITAKKWAALGKTSLDSAQRDLAALVEVGVVRKNAGGSKNTSYELRWE